MERRDCYVYIIFRRDGSPCYVGKGRGNRWAHHFRRKTNPDLMALIEAARGDLPVVIIRRELADRDALKIERTLIRAIGRDRLVNKSPGGTGGRSMSLEARAKMSAAKKGRPKTPEHQAAITRAITGLPKTPEHLANFRKARLGVPVKPASDERKAKVRAATTAYWERWREGGIARRMNNGRLSEARIGTDRGTEDSLEREVRP